LYFEAAAKTGIMEAAYNLGLIHENGLLGESDYSQAVYWYRESSSYGSEEAVTALSQLAKTLNMSVTELEEKYLPEKEDSQVQSPHNMHAHTKDTSQKNTVKSLSNTDFAEPDETSLQPTTTAKQVTIAQIQEQLISIGLFPGPADGVLSPILEDSIRSYQSDHSIEVTGLPSEDLLVHMISTDETKGFGSRE
jgi:hypothetical protein